MKIGLDARILAHPKSGISTYLINLIKEYLNFSELELFLFGDKPIHSEYAFLLNNENLKILIFGINHRKYWAQFYLPYQLRRYNVDIYHAVWNNAVPIFSFCPCVVTIHDLIPLAIGRYFKKRRKKIKYRLQQISAAHMAKAIITDSNNSKKDIIKYLKIPPNKIKVIYLGVESHFYKCQDSFKIKECLKKYKIDKEYIINTAGIDQPRRNARFLVEAFYKFITKFSLDLELIFTGDAFESNKEYCELKRQIKDLGIENRIIFTGRIDDKDMILLLSGAKMMVFPSLYEGFGLPLLEAMACGIPVIALNNSAIPEITKDASLLVEVQDQEGLIKAMQQLYFDNTICQRLISKGLQRIKDFSWEKTALETVEIYREVLKRWRRYW